MVTFVQNFDKEGNKVFKKDGSAEFVLKEDRLYDCNGHKVGEKFTSAMVSGDISPYISTIDGSYIGSRSTHRRHLREHNCIEIGTDSMDTAQTYFNKDNSAHDKQRKREIIDVVNKHYETK